MEKPILFDTKMVQAILNEKKTTTRQIIKRTPSNDEPCGYGFWKEFNDGKWYIKDYTHNCLWWTLEEYISKFGKYHVGDILYVKETWRIQSMSNSDKRVKIMYKAIGNKDLETRYVGAEKYEELLKYECKNGWIPSLFMPKLASRIFLEVTDIKIERLQDIKDEGAKEEGSNAGIGVAEKMKESAIDRFKRTWDSKVNKKELNKINWEANPWVWVIEFKMINK